MHGQTDAWRVPGYTEIRELGRGGAGRVVLARHDADDILVAIKYLADALMSDLHFVARFRHEARLLASMDPSPHAAKFYEYVEVPRGAAIVMELINGVSLRAMLRSEGPTGPEAALVVLKGSLLGLAAAHGVGVVHRDYKPENVMVEADGMSKLVDFGIATQIGQGGSAVSGTPPYMAPEQWSGGPAGPATDVYAATVVFFECLTGGRPFRAQNMAALARQHQVTPPPVEEVPPSLRGLVERGMAKRAADRPRSALEFLQELELVAADVYGPAWEERGRRRLAALAGLLVQFFPLAEEASEVGTSIAETNLGRGLLGKVSTKIGLTVVVMAAVAGGTAALVGSLTGTTLQSDETIMTPSTSPADPLTVAPATDEATAEPTETPTETGSADDPKPTASSTRVVRPRPTATGDPVQQPTATPTARPTPSPTAGPTPKPSPKPSPTPTPTRKPSPTQSEPDTTITLPVPKSPAPGSTTPPATSRPTATQNPPSSTPPSPTPPSEEPGEGTPSGDAPPSLTASPEAPDGSAVPAGVFAIGLMTAGLVPATLAVKRATGRRRRRDSR
ncbi:protein kinase [Sphaerimonospora cavernae]|uniref:non-specific serine/threonine protein kinase n=1 Tax=Sphaerimonospora cavernae TaxID=1740611 RepID=A0ABV6U477_9ACTN